LADNLQNYIIVFSAPFFIYARGYGSLESCFYRLVSL